MIGPSVAMRAPRNIDDTVHEGEAWALVLPQWIERNLAVDRTIRVAGDGDRGCEVVGSTKLLRMVCQVKRVQTLVARGRWRARSPAVLRFTDDIQGARGQIDNGSSHNADVGFDVN